MTSQFDLQGFAIVAEVVPSETIDRLIAALAEAPHAVRNLIANVPEVADLCRSRPIRQLAQSILGPDGFAVRGIFFDKTPETNWKVAWHQDLTIAVRERIEVEGFGPWSEKAGIVHVQPPEAVLQRMVTLRVHLDPCGVDNGPLRVIAGSHEGGKLDANAISRIRETSTETACLVDRGGVVIMRPLLLHASSPAKLPAHRRVIHLEFAAEALPGGLEWHGRW